MKFKIYFNVSFYLMLTAAIIFILFSNPFLKIPYDPLTHIMRIASLHDDGSCFVFWPGDKRGMCFWHQIWANVFKFSGINDFLIWAKIIHVFQFFLAGILVFYFSKTALTLLTTPSHTFSEKRKEEGKHIDTQHEINREDSSIIKILALFAVFLWFIGNGTFSVAYQQAWIMWYSVTYMGLTIPLFWYSTALTLKIFYEDLASKKKAFYIAQIIAASLFIAKAHPLEFLYYLYILFIILLFNAKRILSTKNKKYLFISIPVILLLIIIAVRYLFPVQVPLFKVFSRYESIAQMVQQINILGHNIASTDLNRFPNSFSGIALVSLIAMIILRCNLFLKKDRDLSFSKHVLDYLLVVSIVFFLIPVVPFLAGLNGLLTHETVVWRFFFASPWFLFLPFLIYKLITTKEISISKSKSVIMLIVTTMLIVLSLVYFRKYFYPLDRTSQNIASMVHSLNKEKVGINYSQHDIETLRAIVNRSTQSEVEGKPNIYFVRGDVAYVVRGIFRKYVYLSRHTSLSRDSFFTRGLDKRYNLIDIDLPENFHIDREIFDNFPRLRKQNKTECLTCPP